MSDLFSVDIDKYLPLRDVVFFTIRDAIISGDLKQGERLMEKRLAEQIGVSRTPVREALRKLETEGFVEMIPRKGAIVTIVTERDIKDVLQVRAVLEGLAAKLACDSMTDSEIERLFLIKKEFEEAVKNKEIDIMVKKDVEFHDLIFDSTNNQKLIQLINNLREQIYRYRLAYLRDVDYLNQIVNEHEFIFLAIKNRDKEKSEALSVEHINNQEKAVVKSIKKK